MKFIAPALLLIGLIFAIAMLVGINRHLDQKETANKAEWQIVKQEQEANKRKIILPEPIPELKEVSDCDRGYIKGYTKGYNNGIKSYCGTGADIKGFEPSVMCYDIGYDRGFTQGVRFAEQEQVECLKLFKPIELDIEAELNK